MKNLFYLNQKMKEAQHVVVYGAGYYGKEVAGYLTAQGIKISYFCDSSIKADEVDHIKVIRPENLLELNNICIVIANIRAWKQIYDDLIKMGMDEACIVSNVGLNNMCILNGELLRDKKVLIAGADEFGLRLLYKLLDAGIYISGFLDEHEVLWESGLMNKRIFSTSDIRNEQNTVVICRSKLQAAQYDFCGEVSIDNSFQRYYSEKINYKNVGMDCSILYQLVQLKKNRPVVIYGIDEYAINCYEVLKLLDIEIDCFADEIERPNTILGKKILSIDDLKHRKIPYFLYICVEKNYYEHTVEKLQKLGYHENLDFLPVWGSGVERIFDPHLGYITITAETGKTYNGFCTFSAGNQGKSYRILVIGNSTSDPYCVAVKSWCELLRDICNKNGSNVEVISGGVIGYTSAQELIKLIRDGLWLTPDLVISFSGVNDVYDRGEYPFLHPYQLKLCHLFDDKEKNLMSSRGLKREGISVYDHWMNHMRMIHAVLSEFSIPFISIRQPCLWSKKGALDANEEKIQILHKSLLPNEKHFEKMIKNAQNARLEAERDSKSIEWMADFSSIFDSINEVYFDVVHCTEKGNTIIAENVYNLIRDRLCEFFG